MFYLFVSKEMLNSGGVAFDESGALQTTVREIVRIQDYVQYID